MIHAHCSYTGIPYEISSPVLSNPSVRLAHPHFILPSTTLAAIAAMQYKRPTAHTTEALTLNTYALLMSTGHFTFMETLADASSDVRRADILSNLELALLYIGRWDSVSRHLPHINIYKDSALGDILEIWATAEADANESHSKRESYKRLALTENRLADLVSKGRTHTPVYARRVVDYISELLTTPLCDEWAALIVSAITGKTTRSSADLMECEDLIEMLETNPAFLENYSSYHEQALTSLRTYLERSTNLIKYGEVTARKVKFDLLGLDAIQAVSLNNVKAAFAAGEGASLETPPVESDFPDKISYLIAKARYVGAKK